MEINAITDFESGTTYHFEVEQSDVGDITSMFFCQSQAIDSNYNSYLSDLSLWTLVEVTVEDRLRKKLNLFTDFSPFYKSNHPMCVGITPDTGPLLDGIIVMFEASGSMTENFDYLPVKIQLAGYNHTITFYTSTQSFPTDVDCTNVTNTVYLYINQDDESLPLFLEFTMELLYNTTTFGGDPPYTVARLVDGKNFRVLRTLNRVTTIYESIFPFVHLLDFGNPLSFALNLL